jgi:hypothetical protein
MPVEFLTDDEAAAYTSAYGDILISVDSRTLQIPHHRLA